jgi:hypothetical protein
MNYVFMLRSVLDVEKLALAFDAMLKLLKLQQPDR